jgi:hypothetical protein
MSIHPQYANLSQPWRDATLCDKPTTKDRPRAILRQQCHTDDLTALGYNHRSWGA